MTVAIGLTMFLALCLLLFVAVARLSKCMLMLWVKPRCHVSFFIIFHYFLMNYSGIVEKTLKYCFTVISFRFSNFYHASACLCVQSWYCYVKSVHLSICPSHSGIASKWMHISSDCFHLLLGAWLLVFLEPTAVTKFQGKFPQQRR